MNYFITFRTYGTWLPGEVRGSIDKEHNQYGQPRRAVSKNLRNSVEASMTSPKFVMTPRQRCLVDEAIRGVTEYRGWILHELNVRSNHVHVILSVPEDVTKEKAFNDFKTYSTRKLRESGTVNTQATLWERHGSTQMLFTSDEFDAACQYVRDFQDNPELRGLV